MSFPYTPPTDNSSYRGQLLQEKFYDQNGTLLKKATHSYAHYGWQIGQGGYKVKAYWYDAPFGTWYEYAYQPNMLPTTAACNWYDLRGNAFDIFKTIDSTYTDEGVHVTETRYDYDNTYNNRMFLKRINTTLASGQTRQTIFRYAFNNVSDFTFGLTGAEQTMKSTLLTKNYLKPLEVVDSLFTSGTDYILGGKKFIFDTFNGGKIHLNRLRTYTTFSDYNDLVFSSYSTKGRLQEQYQEGDAKEVFLWGYNDNYPVATVKGSDYSTVSAYVNSSVLNSPTSSEVLLVELDKIRAGLSSTYAQVSTFTYDRLIGMSTSTDQRGVTTYFSYDGFSRLALIQDHEKRILKRYCYNYQGQAGECSLLGNVQKSGNFTKNDCQTGYQGTTHSYVVPANTYYGATQADADTRAQGAVNANGQAYANEVGTCQLLYYNVQKSGQFTRNNCANGYTGTTLTYYVPAGTHSSTVSQAAADQLAIDDVNNNGQNYANINGACLPDLVELFYVDYGSASSPYFFTLTNLMTSQEFQFQTDPYATPNTPVYVADIPPGPYLVEIYNPYNGGAHYYEACYSNSYSGSITTFLMTGFDQMCSTIIIDY